MLFRSADADAVLDVGRHVAAEYLTGQAPFQDQVHLRAFVFDFLSSHAMMLRGWADRTEVFRPAEAGVSAPDSPCECRSGGPAEPASRPRTPPSGSRPDRDRTRLIRVMHETEPAINFVGLVSPTESPPGIPLYLRTSRLLT